MIYTRRHIIKGGAISLAGLAYGRSAAAALNERRGAPSPSRQDPRLRQLIQAAVDAATSAGASYADARLTFTQLLSAGKENDLVPSNLNEAMNFGVRAFVQGYWGFAASTIWNNDEAARLGRAAVQNARANLVSGPREVELAPHPNPVSGDWVMPVKNDPFEMAWEEISDHLFGLKSWIERNNGENIQRLSYGFRREDKAFGSSLNQFTTQRLYRTSGDVLYTYIDRSKGIAGLVDLERHLMPAGLGFEYIRDKPLREIMKEHHEEIIRDSKVRLPVIPIDVGRYSVLAHDLPVIELLRYGIGVATQVERVLGMEANNRGTSYIMDPLEELGSFKVGSSIMNVSGGRSERGSVNCVKWDDEGVEPPQFDLIRQGVVTNLQSTREGAGWIAPYLNAAKLPVSSTGCTYVDNAWDIPLGCAADLVLQPNSYPSYDLDALREEMEEGLEVAGARPDFDYQQVTGFAQAAAWQIKKGKRVAVVTGGAMSFQTPELWGNLIQLGGPGTVGKMSRVAFKGEPFMNYWNCVTAPAAVFKDVTWIDALRKG